MINSKHDLSNKTFGEWQVTETHKRIKGRTHWLCRCTCGNEVFVLNKSLTRSVSKSCGHNRGHFGKGVSRPRFKDGTGPLRQIYRRYIRQAKERNIEFSLTLQFFIKTVLNHCHYCDDIPRNTAKHSRGIIQIKYNGLDRQDNSLGYTETNCVPCCKNCNRAKSSMTYFDFMEWVKRLVKKYDN